MLNTALYKRYIDKAPYVASADSLTWWFAFNDGKLLVKTSHEKIYIPQMEDLATLGLPISCKHYLGLFDGHNCFAVGLSTTENLNSDFSLMNLRACHGLLEEDEFLLAGKASQLVHWDSTHRFCGRCGHPTENMAVEHAKKCPSCGFISYPVISPAVITAILKGDKILLAHNAHFAGNMHSLVAGFVEPGETLEEAAQREILEEVGLKVKNVRYFSSQPWPFPNSLMVGFTAEYESGDIHVDGVEILHADWFDKYNLPDIPQKISIARKIIDWYVNK